MKKPLAEKPPKEMLSLSLSLSHYFSLSCGPPNLQEIEDGF